MHSRDFSNGGKSGLTTLLFSKLHQFYALRDIYPGALSQVRSQIGGSDVKFWVWLKVFNEKLTRNMPVQSQQRESRFDALMSTFSFRSRTAMWKPAGWPDRNGFLRLIAQFDCCGNVYASKAQSSPQLNGAISGVFVPESDSQLGTELMF